MSLPADGIDRRALAALMRAQGLAATETLEIDRLTGGQSNPTFCVTAGSARYVLRKQPAGPLLPSAHAIDREYRVMAALRGSGVPVPQVHLYCADTGVVGTPFFLMEYLDGRVLLDPALPGMTRDERFAIYAEMNRVLATLHAVDPAVVGLSDFGKAGNYFARQIARWSRQYRGSRIDAIAEMDLLIDWLPQHVPPGDVVSIVHGDYRVDNLVWHHSESRVIGVLDWELSTLGHPLADFSYHCMVWHVAPALWRGIGGLDLDALGIPSESWYVSRYLETTGIDAGAHWDFYMAYNLFRMAAILQGIAQRAADGNAASDDAHATGRKAGPLAALGWKFAQRYGSSRG